MDGPSIHPIWQPETGIIDLEDDSGELSTPEIPGIKAVWADQRQRLKGTTQLSAFTEQMSREWAIETGVLENLYEIDRGVIQTLIEHGFQAELLHHGSTNKPRAYVIQLLKDQKDALDGIFDFVKGHRQFSISYIKELHAALLRSQDTIKDLDVQGSSVKIPLIKGDWKKQKNYPVRDGVTYICCPPEQVGSEMDRLVTLHNQHRNDGVSSEVQAAWLHHRFTQIHPFQDGNGRVARAIASLVLVKDGLFPLVVRQDDRILYLKTLEAADEGNSKSLINLIIKLQLAQFRKATKIAETFHVPSAFTPTWASWIKQVEGWFGVIRQKAIRRGSLHKEVELTRKVNAIVEHYNGQARPFMWLASAESILANIERLCKHVSGTLL